MKTEQKKYFLEKTVSENNLLVILMAPRKEFKNIVLEKESDKHFKFKTLIYNSFKKHRKKY